MISAIVATPLQLFNVMIILKHHYPAEKCDLYVLDIACDMHSSVNLFNKASIIENVYYINSFYTHKSKLGVIWDHIRTPQKIRALFSQISEKRYDHMLTTFVGHSANLLYDKFHKANPQILLHFYEEGTAIYVRTIKESNIKTRLLYKLLNRPLVENNIDDIFLYKTNFTRRVNTEYPSRPIGKITRVDYLFLSSVSHSLDIEKYHHKVIYLEAGFHNTQYESIDEINLIKLIAKNVGVGNIVVRPHPRTDIKELLSAGYIIDYNSDKNWEMILASEKMPADTILIAHFSTALFTPKMIFDIEPTVIFTGLCVMNENPQIPAAQELWTSYVENMIDALRKIYADKSRVIVPKSYSELSKALEIL